MSFNRTIKIIIVAFLLISLSAGLDLPAAQAAPSRDPLCGSSINLVGCWRMEEGSGVTLVDGSGNGLDATTVESPTWSTPGKVGNYSLHLNGSNQYAYTQPDPQIGILNAITITAWFKSDSTISYDQTLVSKAKQNTVDGFELSLSGTETAEPPGGKEKIYFRVNQQSSGNKYRVNSKNKYPLNGTGWRFVAGTYDGAATGKSMDLFIDGVLDEYNDLAVPGPDSISPNTLPLVIGAQVSIRAIPPPLYNSSRLFAGNIDDVRIYNRALTGAEINTLFSSPTAVNLASFSASAFGSSVHLTWTTASEEDLVSFNLYRSTTPNGEAHLVNPSPIPALSFGRVTGASYQFADMVDLGQHYFYRLELVKQDGAWPGPQVSVDTGYWVHMPLLFH
ncbi:MAG: LamG domain-containing protein [Anaerolineaceae bacterium]|nr:LamG domain-containing protein [Anaerolineaceae bacterium]